MKRERLVSYGHRDLSIRLVIVVLGVSLLVLPIVLVMTGAIDAGSIAGLVVLGIVYMIVWRYTMHTTYSYEQNHIVITIAGLWERRIDREAIVTIKPYTLPRWYGCGIRYLWRQRVVLYTTSYHHAYAIVLHNGRQVIITPHLPCSDRVINYYTKKQPSVPQQKT